MNSWKEGKDGFPIGAGNDTVRLLCACFGLGGSARDKGGWGVFILFA
ncbi:hypothetical protein ACFL4T_09300 [candidate division KSB1 bacterium]